MDYDNQIEKILSLIKNNDDQGFINLIKDLDEKKEFIPLYEYLRNEYNYEYVKQFEKKLMESDETLNIFGSNFPYKLFIKIFYDDYNLKYRIRKDLIANMLLAFSESFDDMYYFIEFLEKAIDEKDDEMIEGFYDIFKNNIGYTEKSMMIDSGNAKTAQKIIDENYNKYSTEIAKFLLSDYVVRKEQEKIRKMFEERSTFKSDFNVIDLSGPSKSKYESIEPLFEKILFDYVDSKEKLYGKKVVMFDKDKKYSMNYDYFIRNLIYSSYSFFKEGERYFMSKFLADKLDVKECHLPEIYVVRKKENVNIFEVFYNNSINTVDFDIRFKGDLNDKQKEIIHDMINRLNKCSYGFQAINNGIIDKTGKITHSHAGYSFFEKIENNINIYYYEPHGTDQFTSTSSRMGMRQFLEYYARQIEQLYPNLKVNVDFVYSGCLRGLQTYTSEYDIGMCQSWTFFWMFLVSKTLDYIKKNNINLTVKQWLPLIEQYFTEEVSKEKVYNLLISFISQLYLDFYNENEAFNSHIKKRLREYYLKPKFIKKGFEEGIQIEDITGREIYELEKMKKEYKEYVNKLAVLTEDFVKRQEALKDVKRRIKEEEKKVSEKEGKKLFENCSYDLDCATKCCKTMGRAKICVPEKECRIRHIYGKGYTKKKE
jgi:hypothetical protein